MDERPLKTALPGQPSQPGCSYWTENSRLDNDAPGRIGLKKKGRGFLLQRSSADPNSEDKPGMPTYPGMSNILDANMPPCRQRLDSDENPDLAHLALTELDFVYNDTDSYVNEIAELYSYTELPEFPRNYKAFEDLMAESQLKPLWQNLTPDEQKVLIFKWLNLLDMSNHKIRMKAARCFLYLAQGCWAEQQSDEGQQLCTLKNVMLLYQYGVFSAHVDLLNIHIKSSVTVSIAPRKFTVCVADSVDLRIILSTMYIIIEVMRETLNDDNCEDELKKSAEAFRADLRNGAGEELLPVQLLMMVTRFCGGGAPHFPMKKVLLVLWKVLLITLGGMETLKELKAQYRNESGLPPWKEDTIKIAQAMRPSSPPGCAADVLEAQALKLGALLRRGLTKQSSLDESQALEFECSTENAENDEDKVAPTEEMDYGPDTQPPSPRPETPVPAKVVKLPWVPKVRAKDLDGFLDTSRSKFIGFTLPGDRDTLIGLPEPIHEGVSVLKQHMYTSLAEVQIQNEDAMARNPFSLQEKEIPMNPTEVLYQAMLLNLPQYMIALLKILLAAAPTSKSKSDTVNILSDVLPEDMPITVLQSMRLGIDVNRHKEIVVKAVSAIILLLLKHFKVNHVYQFEFMSQHLAFANCIPLVLKFFNQNIAAYIGAKNVVPILDFPSCVIGDQSDITTETLEIGNNQLYSWRNVFSCINLLRILNKLTKWKHSRVMMLVVFKSAPILKRTLKVRLGMMQLYVLKLLKMQTKYLGRQWRKSNMKTFSAIYSKVRHRLNDDWAYGNDMDAQPWDFQSEECALRANVDRFNNRRYGTGIEPGLISEVDTNIQSVLSTDVQLSEEFKQCYEVWLHQALNVDINWDELIDHSYL